MSQNQTPLKVGVAGVGVMGRNHARVLGDIRDFDLTHIFDADAVTAQGVAELYGATPVTSVEAFVDAGLEAAVEQAIIATRQYAKRQRTWFRHQLDCNLVISEALPAQESASEWGKFFSFIDGFLLTGPA